MSRRRCYLTTPLFGTMPDDVVWEMSLDEERELDEPFPSYTRYRLCVVCQDKWHDPKYKRCYRCQRAADRQTVVRVKEKGVWRKARQ